MATSAIRVSVTLVGRPAMSLGSPAAMADPRSPTVMTDSCRRLPGRRYHSTLALPPNDCPYPGTHRRDNRRDTPEATESQEMARPVTRGWVHHGFAVLSPYMSAGRWTGYTQ